MGMQSMDAVNALFLPAWQNAKRQAKEATSSGQRRAMESYYKAVQNCDKATENMMDKHHKSVAESAKKIAEYRKRKARLDKTVEAAEKQRLFHENMLIERINHQNMLEGMRIDELNRKELLGQN